MGDTRKSKPEAAFAPTDPADPRAVVVVTVDDVQQVAQQTINRDLSGIELMQVQAFLEAELRTETVQDAICKLLDVRRVPDTEQHPMRPTHGYDVQHYRREIEYTIGVLEKHLELIKRWQRGDDMGQVDSETARFSLANARRHIEYANVRQDNPEQHSVETLHDMSVRKEALIKFYERFIADFKGDLLDRLLFIQCLAALDSDEGHCLAWLYTEEFNRTLILYQEAKER